MRMLNNQLNKYFLSAAASLRRTGQKRTVQERLIQETDHVYI